MNEIYENRPAALKGLDQVHMGPDSVVRTCNKLGGYIGGKDLLFIGDDDLMSVTMFRLCNPRLATVLDIDKRILGHIEGLARKYNFNIQTKSYDVLGDLPIGLVGSADFFYTNPPYGSKNQGDSCKAFILRGIEGIKIGCHGAFIMGSGNQHGWARKVEERTLRFTAESGCSLIETFAEFQSYHANPIKSSMFLIRKDSEVKPNKKFLEGIVLY